MSETPLDLDQFPYEHFAGNALRAPQVAARIGFRAWLEEEQTDTKMGHIILPMGSGKTALAVLFAEDIRIEKEKKTLVISWSKNTGEAFAKSCAAHAAADGLDLKASFAMSGQRARPESNFIVTNFNSKDNWPNLSEIGLIIVDEADVNGLSEKRAAELRNIAKIHKIPIVALSATDQQASRKCIEDVFPDEILAMAIPNALKELLEKGLIPEMEFYDKYLNATLTVQPEGKEIPEEELDALASQSWNEQLLDFYDQNLRHRVPKAQTAFIYRNNSLLEDLLTRAAKRGLKIAKLTGDETEKDFERIKIDLQTGKLDGVAGSKKLGRGTDIPGIDTVLDSQITKSPQMFWQAKGRAFRLDPRRPNKEVQIYNFLPSKIRTSEGARVDRYTGPLTHGSFFSENYYERDRKTGDSLETQVKDRFALGHIANIRSGREVLQIRDEYNRKHPDFLSLAELIAARIAAIQEVTSGKIHHVVARRGPRPADANPILDWNERQTFQEEHAAIAQAQAGDKLAMESLLKANRPVIAAIAKALNERPEVQEELIQVGMERLYLSIFKYKHGQARLIRFAIKGLLRYMTLFDTRLGKTSMDILETARKKQVDLEDLQKLGADRKTKKKELKLKGLKEEDTDYALTNLEHLVEGNIEERLEEIETSDLKMRYTIAGPEEMHIKAELKDKAQVALASLRSDTQLVLRQRFFEGLSLEEAASKRIHPTTRDYIRIIEAKGIRKLRNSHFYLQAFSDDSYEETLEERLRRETEERTKELNDLKNRLMELSPKFCKKMENGKWTEQVLIDCFSEAEEEVKKAAETFNDTHRLDWEGTAQAFNALERAMKILRTLREVGKKLFP